MSQEVLGENEQQLTIAYGGGKWSDLADQPITGGVIERAVLLPFGSHNGNHTVELLIRTVDGRLIHANTTYALFQGMAEAFQHWYNTK